MQKTQYSLAFFCQTFLTFFVCVFCFSLSFPPNSISSHNPLYIWNQSQLEDIIVQFHNENLARNFLTNERSLNFFEQNDFLNSGLVHLLAISGAQVVPIVNAARAAARFAAPSVMNFVSSPQQATRAFRLWREGSSVVLSLFILKIFGGSGALGRVFFLTYVSQLILLKNFSFQLSRIFPNISERSISRTFSLVGLAVFAGDPFKNYSFLLSAFGAALSELTFTLLTSAKSFQTLISKVNSMLLTSAICTFFISVLLYPLCQNALFPTVIANLIAIPLVTFIITPLSLVLVLVPFKNCDLLIFTLDAAFSMFKNISATFSTQAFSSNASSELLFSEAGRFYLVLMVTTLWSLTDTLKHRGLFMLRKQIC